MEKKSVDKELAATRAAFDRVLAAAIAERTDTISIYDCAIWILYACMRSDAISSADEILTEGEEHSIRDEIDDAIDIAENEIETASIHENDAKTLGEKLDPEFNEPAHRLIDWLGLA